MSLSRAGDQGRESGRKCMHSDVALLLLLFFFSFPLPFFFKSLSYPPASKRIIYSPLLYICIGMYLGKRRQRHHPFFSDIQ